MFKKLSICLKLVFKKLAYMFIKHYICTIKLNIKLQTTEDMAKKKTITGELEPMKIGESKEFPASLCTTARSMASMLGFKWNRVYKTETDRERRVVIVKRIS